MAKILKAACVQMTSGPVIEDNLKEAQNFIREAAGQGAQFVATPEVTDQIIAQRAEKLDQALDHDHHPGVTFFADLAAELSIDLLIGSMCIKVAEDKIAARSFLFGPDGAIKATYDKIHLYDVDLPTGESWRESKIFVPGDKAVIDKVSRAKLGMTICYDLRFPHLYREAARKGAQIFTIPAAFTVPTGMAHWSVLMRARAIECGAFVMAPAQVGDHQGARVTYGHSVIINPWGEILAEADGANPGIILADLDMEAVIKARQAIPALQHDREYAF